MNGLDMLRNFLDKLIGKKGNSMVICDFNRPKLTWVDCMSSIEPDFVGQCMTVFLDILEDYNLTYIVTEPTSFSCDLK